MAYETPMGGDEDQMSEQAPAEAPQKDEESLSIFVPKAFMMGTKFKPGDIMEVKVVDIDSETGDAEIKYNTGKENDHEYGDESPSMKGFDAAMPESE